ncbi:MAG TPA: ATP synthase F1 subunit delta [Acidobacteriaceae bacterium]|jgi:F-type H+-transporting ATPase subunit delta|nr:ATP synthase F1 subunit delta [Acidobacteriaceae bacterium]
MAAIDLRYARALAEVIADQKMDLVAAQGQLSDFAAMLESSVDLREVLQNPSIPEAQKLKLLDAIAQRAGFSQAIRNFLALLTHHQRLHEIRAMITAYGAIADAETGVAEAEITTARPLDDESRRLLEAQVAKMAGDQRVQATYREDASLLGGAVVKIGSTVYDGSVRAQLEQLKRRMVAA